MSPIHWHRSIGYMFPGDRRRTSIADNKSQDTELQDTVNTLLDKAAKSEKSEDALRFSQAALNASHTNHAMSKLRD